eukprot:TRINITY_DN29998_c0_g1_i1.p1 TRINITY_DN29998_c0_g1~~TRINITY_DN29998_c0_g1_i1.p1  ORF type:complete len:906 (+),score=175.51 TRINITY_DN29998_c0_g1_i1:23-2740(+)
MSSTGCLPTPPPLRFTLKSHDKLTQISMKISWIDDRGQEHTWNSWEDGLCGRFGATKLLPASSIDIKVRFQVQPGGRKVHEVDRHRNCAWTKQGEEAITFRSADSEDDSHSIDAFFEARGPLTHCHIWKAWNAHNEGHPEYWECWPDFPSDRVEPPPKTLAAADLAAPWPGNRHAVAPASPSSANSATSEEGEDHAAYVASAMRRLCAAAEVLVDVRRETLETLEELNSKLTKQWYRVNSGNTVAAGLAVASFGALFAAPPVGLALGVGSAAAGVGATTSDAVGDHGKSRNLTKLVGADLCEQMGFETVEAELQATLESAAISKMRLHRSSPGRRRAGTALSLGVQTASLVAVRSARAVAMTRAGAEGLSVVGKVFGGLGAGLAVGVAIHGWSTLKPTQKMVQEKITEAQRSLDYLQSLLNQMGGVLHCPLCQEQLCFGGDTGTAIKRCAQFHCFHEHCFENSRTKDDAFQGCPVCPSASVPVSAVRSGHERLRALFWLSGLRELCTHTVDSLDRQVLRRGRELAEQLASKADEVVVAAEEAALRQFAGKEPVESRRQALPVLLARGARSNPDAAACPRKHLPAELPEDAETHEAWQDAVEEAGGNATELAGSKLDRLLASGRGMPLKYRHRIWPHWLNVSERRVSAATAGDSFTSWASAAVPERIKEQVDADVPRTRSDFVAPSQRERLRRLLLAVSAKHPDVGYAQGMNQLAAVILKLGFDDELSFWMLEAMLQDILPGCHHPDLHGLFRDTAVADILVQTFLPAHAAAFSAAGIEMLWFTVDYFITLGSDAPLPLVASLWDLVFLHGSPALFSGLLAMLELFFPLAKASEGFEAEDLMRSYKASLLEASAECFASTLLRFLNEYQGGISVELVDGLRSSVSGAGQSPGTSEPAAASPPPRSF